MAKRAVNTDRAAPPGGPYSQAVVAGDTVYLAGAIPALPDGTRVTGSFADQARAAFVHVQDRISLLAARPLTLCAWEPASCWPRTTLCSGTVSYG